MTSVVFSTYPPFGSVSITAGVTSTPCGGWLLRKLFDQMAADPIFSCGGMARTSAGYPVSLGFLVQIIVCGFCGEVAFATHPEVAADERLEVAIEYFVDVAYFDASTKIFGHAVRLQ